MTNLADTAIGYLRAVAGRSLTWEPEKREALAALDAIAAELADTRAELDRLRAIEDRANRVVVHMPDPDWIKCARIILDGHAGKYVPGNTHS